MHGVFCLDLSEGGREPGREEGRDGRGRQQQWVGTLARKGVMGSLSLETRSCIRKSRIMKLVAHVSSSISRQSEPIWEGRKGGGEGERGG